MENKNNKPQIDTKFNEIWDRAGDYKYSFESSNDAAWEKFQADREQAAQKQKPFVVLKNTQRIWRIAAAITLLAIGSWAFWFNNQANFIMWHSISQSTYIGHQHWFKKMIGHWGDTTLNCIPIRLNDKICC